MAGKKALKGKKEEISSESSEEPQEKPNKAKPKPEKPTSSKEESKKPNKPVPKKPKKDLTDSDSSSEETIMPPPKRALSAYLYFCSENREKIIASNADAKPSEILKLLSAAWKKCSDRRKFDELSAKDKQRYERQKKEFDESGKYFDENGALVKAEVRKQKSSKKGKEPLPKKKKSHN